MSNTPLEQNGIDLDSVLEKVNALPQAGITPTGSITLTEEKSYDVTEKAQAVVDFSSTRADLAEAITAKGIDTLPDSSFDAMIANVGLISGGSLPPSISKIDGGSFTLANDTLTSDYNINHNLGVIPKGFAVWCDTAEGPSSIVQFGALINGYSLGRLLIYTDGSMDHYNMTSYFTTALTSTFCCLYHGSKKYQGWKEYKWLAWA